MAKLTELNKLTEHIMSIRHRVMYYGEIQKLTICSFPQRVYNLLRDIDIKNNVIKFKLINAIKQSVHRNN